MNEMGGGLTNRANKLYRSTDGGNTWTNTLTAPPSPGLVAPHAPTPTSPACLPDTGGYWRHMGWGQPAVLNNDSSLRLCLS